MPSCREVRERLTDYAEGALPWRESMALRVHLLLCEACNGFHLGLKALPSVARRLLAHADEPPPAEAVAALENALRHLGCKARD